MVVKASRGSTIDMATVSPFNGITGINLDILCCGLDYGLQHVPVDLNDIIFSQLPAFSLLSV